MFYYPDRNVYYIPQNLGLKKIDITMKTQDGLNIYGWLFPPVNVKGKAKGTIVQFHGNAENMTSHFSGLVWITEFGYQLFTFDYRGYGNSEGSPDQYGTHLDALSALNKAVELHNEHAQGGKLVIFGQSLGGAVALRAYCDFEKQNMVNLIVADSTFSSYTDIAFKKLKQSWITFLFSPLAFVLVSDQYSAENKIDQIDKPILVMHDRYDPIVPFTCGEDIYRKAKHKLGFWQLDDGLHTGAFWGKDKERYRQLFVKMLETI